MIFKDMAVCDLRGYNTAEAAGKIKEIIDSALVILPKNMDEATKSAFASIKMQDVASTMYADDNCKVNIYNGEITLSGGNISGENIWVVNGIACILPLPEGTHVSLIVNGIVYNDISNKNTVELLSVNGEVKVIDTENAVILPDKSKLENNMLCGEKKYFGDGDIIIGKVSNDAQASVEACGKIYAHESVKQSKIRLISDGVVYYKGDDIIFKKNVEMLHISQAFLQEINGALVLKNIAKLIIEKDVDPQLLNEKVLEIKNAGKIIVPGKTFDIVQLKSQNVGKIKRKR